MEAGALREKHSHLWPGRRRSAMLALTQHDPPPQRAGVQHCMVHVVVMHRRKLSTCILLPPLPPPLLPPLLLPLPPPMQPHTHL